MKIILKIILFLFCLTLVFCIGVVGWLTIVEYRPNSTEKIIPDTEWESFQAQKGQTYKIVTWNTGYSGLGKDSDFFMDGGKMVNGISREVVEENTAGIISTLNMLNADIAFLQEVDTDSNRSFYINQVEKYKHGLGKNSAFACNYRCSFVPFPLPPIGKVDSGIATLSNFQIADAERISLPNSFSWPIRIAQLKRCLLIERIPVEDMDKELILVNFHLEAYDSGEGKVAQTKQLMDLLKAELDKGNYVIAGGDFNQTFEGAIGYPKNTTAKDWLPGNIYNSDLAPGFRFVFDATKPTCRSLLKPYSGNRDDTGLYLIDGFIVSNNVKIKGIETMDVNFQHSDHNPVTMQFSLE